MKAATPKGPTVMTISLIPVAVAVDPPAPSSAPSSNRGRPSFGDFVDHADARASDNASARQRQPAANDDRRDNNNNNLASANGAADQTAPSQASPASTASADRSSGQGRDKSQSQDHSAPATGGKHGKGPAAKGDQSTGDKASQPAAVLAAATPAAIAAVVPPIAALIAASTAPATSLPTGDKSALPEVGAVIADATASGPSAIAETPSKGQGAWRGVITAANAKTDPIAAPATPMTTAVATTTPASATTGTSASTTPQGDSQAAAKAIGANVAVPADAAPLAAPAIAGTAMSPTAIQASDAPPVVGPATRRGSVSTQTAALLDRAAPGTTQPQMPAPTAATARPTGSTTAPTAGSAVRTVMGTTATAALPVTPAAPPSDTVAAPAASSNSPPVALATPLSPVASNVDLAGKLSPTALPAHGEVLAPAAKPRTETARVTAPSLSPVAGRPAVLPATAAADEAATAGAVKPVGDIALAGVAADATVPGDEDAAAVPAAAAAPIGPQQQGDVVGLPNGTPAIVRAPEAPVVPVAALHSVTDQVTVSLKRGVKEGNDQIQINLEPASLGKIAVRLDFAQDGRVTATFSADRPDTLTLLNQDSRALEQSLRDAGLRADSGSLTFNLSGGDNGSNARQFAQSASYAATAATMADNDPLAPLPGASTISNGLSHDGGLDIHV